jgi:hypothetical protein
VKTFSHYVSDADNSTDVIKESLSPTVLRAAGVATIIKLKSQLSRMTTPDGKALANALNSLATLITLYQYVTQNER